MKYNNYLYQIADIRIFCQLPFPLTIGYESEEFLHTLEECADFSAYEVRAVLKKVSCMPKLPEGGYWHMNRYYVYQNGRLEVFFSTCKGKDVFLHTIYEDQGRSIEAFYLDGFEKELCYSKNLFDWIGIENLLLAFSGFILHASLIDVDGNGILFTAPSGTGKSTQADLWHHFRQATIINGDRGALRKMADGWRAYGLPYAGSSLIYKQMWVPVKGIVFLEQAEENKVERMHPMEAFRFIFPEVSMYRWSQTHTNKVIDYLTELLFNVPIYRLKCTPDVGAVEVLEQALHLK